MQIKKYIIVIILAAAFVPSAPIPVCSWWFSNKTDAQLLQEALASDNPGTVSKCLDRQIELRNHLGILRLKQHAIRMVQKDRARISGIEDSTSADLAKGLAPWKQIIEKADSLTRKKNAIGQTSHGQ